MQCNALYFADHFAEVILIWHAVCTRTFPHTLCLMSVCCSYSSCQHTTCFGLIIFFLFRFTVVGIFVIRLISIKVHTQYTYCPVHVLWWILIEYWLLSTWERWTSSNLLFSLVKKYLCVMKFSVNKHWMHVYISMRATGANWNLCRCQTWHHWFYFAIPVKRRASFKVIYIT